MTTDITELAQSLKAAAEKATPGEWWSDVVETGGTHGSGEDCMEGFHSYAVYDQNNHSLLDMTNSTAAVITVEDDGDYVMAWDEVARRNAEFITLANPTNILALVEALEKAQTINTAAEKLVRCKGRYHSELNYRALAALFGVNTPDLPPLDSESRTVTVKQYDEFQICHYGATEDYAKGYIDCQNNFFKWLTAAGIKLEAE